jgi:hypothetical protein
MPRKLVSLDQGNESLWPFIETVQGRGYRFIAKAIAASRSDPALLRALARGYQWFAELASGRSISTRQISIREGLSESYVRHVVPLGLLAPSIVESICDGKRASTQR